MNQRIGVGLYSGGLDSILAARVLVEQGFHLILVKYLSPVFGSRPGAVNLLSQALPSGTYSIEGIELGKDFFQIIKAPKFGYGKNLNPCLDCKILMLKNAARVMRERDAGFVFTGEVLGQRPMSQRRDTLRIIERESGLDQYLLRPLSARLLPETLAEETGLVDRTALLDISGRSRKRQIALAEKFGIFDYPAPAGGCLLTEVIFASRLRLMLEENKASGEDFSQEDLKLLAIGRHFLLHTGIRVIVGRNQVENELLWDLARENDLLFQVIDIPGPTSLARGDLSPLDLELAAAITARYSDAKAQEKVEVSFGLKLGSTRQSLIIPPAMDEILEPYKIR